MSRRDEIIAKLKEQLDHLNQQIDAMEVKAQQATGEARQQYTARVSELKEMAKPAQQKLGELVAAGEDRWHKIEAETEKVYKAFVHSYNYFKSQLK